MTNTHFRVRYPKGVKKSLDQALHYYSHLNKVYEYVNYHYDESIDLAMAAGIAGLERTYFSRYFHDKTGMGFHQWLNSIRIKHAMGKMVVSEQPLIEIAFSVGFQDLRTFQRAFKKYAGCCPREFKRRIRPA